MGVTLEGTVSVGGQKVNVRGDFGSDHVIFSGGRRGEMKYAQLKVMSTTKGVLKLLVDGATMEFPVGPNVDRLANKIRSPPTRVEKMGFQPGDKVTVEFDDKPFLKELAAAGVDVVESGGRFLVVGARELADLRFDEWMQRFPADGAVWVVYPKGHRIVREIQVLQYGRAAGLKDVKIARFDDKRTAMRFVRPKA